MKSDDLDFMEAFPTPVGMNRVFVAGGENENERSPRPWG